MSYEGNYYTLSLWGEEGGFAVLLPIRAAVANRSRHYDFMQRFERHEDGMSTRHPLGEKRNPVVKMREIIRISAKVNTLEETLLIIKVISLICTRV